MSAEVRACCSLIVWWKFSTNPAESAFIVAVPEWLAATATPVAPPPTSTAAAMPRRAFMLVWRLPRLLRLFIVASSYGRHARHARPFGSMASRLP